MHLDLKSNRCPLLWWWWYLAYVVNAKVTKHFITAWLTVAGPVVQLAQGRYNLRYWRFLYGMIVLKLNAQLWSLFYYLSVAACDFSQSTLFHLMDTVNNSSGHRRWFLNPFYELLDFAFHLVNVCCVRSLLRWRIVYIVANSDVSCMTSLVNVCQHNVT